MLTNTKTANIWPVCWSRLTQLRETYELGKGRDELLPVDASLLLTPVLLGVDQYVAQIAARM